MSKEKNAHYIDNKKFFAEIKVWKEEWDKSVAENRPTPQCTESVHAPGC